MVIQNVAANVYYLVSDLVRRDDVLGARSVLVGLNARGMLRRGLIRRTIPRHLSTAIGDILIVVDFEIMKM